MIATKDVTIKDGSHILYFYNSTEKYIDNAISFVLSAKSLQQQVIFIDNTMHYELLMQRLQEKLNEIEIAETVHYINNYDFYEMYGDFHFERVLTNFKNVVQPYVDGMIPVRVWGHVDWRVQENIKDQLRKYETQADLTVSEIGIMTLCTYNASEVPAAIQIEMMKSHEYFMTDTEIVRSSLYKRKENVVFPSLSFKDKIESELDFYKRKLDFIHVVSHEVRNPLTVIKAFATILKSEIKEGQYLEKLQLIEDYAVAIDHEINHIIQTEQMLTTDVLWKTKLILPLSAVNEVVDIMSLKGRTQNIEVQSHIDISEKLIVKGNLMGFKLIISNLLSNAIKYSHEGQQVKLNAITDSTHLIIEVIDSGVGMSKEEIKNLYNKYAKLNDEKPGQGIGLFMVHKLVEHFKGKISVKSDLGQGSTFTVMFPLA